MDYNRYNFPHTPSNPSSQGQNSEFSTNIWNEMNSGLNPLPSAPPLSPELPKNLRFSNNLEKQKTELKKKVAVEHDSKIQHSWQRETPILQVNNTLQLNTYFRSAKNLFSEAKFSFKQTEFRVKR